LPIKLAHNRRLVIAGHTSAPNELGQLTEPYSKPAAAPISASAISPVLHHDQRQAERYSKFNHADKVNPGHYGDRSLDAAKFWITGGLGGGFSMSS